MPRLTPSLTTCRVRSVALLLVAPTALLTSMPGHAAVTRSRRLTAEPAPGWVAAGVAARDGRVVLRNVTWDSVRVEVRVGAAPACDDNSLLGVAMLTRGRAWAIAASDAVCWRREFTPGHMDGLWTAWTRRTAAEPDSTVAL